MASGFYQHSVTCISEPRRKLIDLRLQQRLTTRQLNQFAVIAFHFAHYLVESHLRAAGEGEFGITPTAAQVTSGCPHENARQSRIARFALNALIDFSDSHALSLHASF